MTPYSHNLTPSFGSVSDLPAVESLYVVALIACYGSTMAIRRRAAAVFLHAAPAAVWGLMARHTTANISHQALSFLTRRAVARFLRTWPSMERLNAESMFLALERSVAQSQMRCSRNGVELTSLNAGQLGVLARLSPDRRTRMIESVRSHISGAELTELALLAQHETSDMSSLVVETSLLMRTRAIRRLEEVLLGAAIHELGVPVSELNAGIAA